jgi:Aldo/keto reductase family
MEEVFKAGRIKREDVFVATKLWNTNHRPERVKPAFEASLKRLQLDYLDLYLIHTPFAFQPGDVQDPRDANGNVIYDRGVELLDTWGAVEKLVDEGKCKAIGLSDVGLERVKEIFEAATIKPAVVHASKVQCRCGDRRSRVHSQRKVTSGGRFSFRSILLELPRQHRGGTSISGLAALTASCSASIVSAMGFGNPTR